MVDKNSINMITDNKKVLFRGEIVSVFTNNEVYEFLVLGTGIIPISKDVDFLMAWSVRSFLKLSYAKELEEIKNKQFKEEIICRGKY